jgi:hypothetical protein
MMGTVFATFKGNIMSDNIKFVLAIPQGWRGGDLPLEEENNPIKLYYYAKSYSF